MKIKVLRRATGQIQEMDLMEYAKGVVFAEVYALDYPRSLFERNIATWPMAALEAQALAVLSYAAYAIAHPRHQEAAVCDGVHCQVYTDHRHERCNAAVEAVRGLFIYHPSSAIPIEACYHASCGGHTENNEDVWPGEPRPYLRRVDGCPCGRGRHGHGVGMCQWGAKALAERGYNAEDIIKFYYTDVTLKGPAPAWYCPWLRKLIDALEMFWRSKCG